MPKHMILLLLQVKFSVSKNVVFYFPFHQCADEEMELISELYVCLNSLCRDRRRRHPAAVWEDVFWILPGVWIRHHLTCFRIECSRVLAGKKKTTTNEREFEEGWDDMMDAVALGPLGFVWINVNFQNLDALHDHLGTIYPGMRAPSFRCTDAEKGNSLILHYYSEREGLQDIVIGIIKTVAQQIHGTEIEMKVGSFSVPPPLLQVRAADHSRLSHDVIEDIRR